jgi:hypothetical protein
MRPTVDQVKSLLKMGKFIIEDDKLVSLKCIEQHIGMKERITLKTIDGTYTFLWQIRMSTKGFFKMSLHLQKSDDFIGLLRIDYHGTHENPQVAPDNLPDELRPYVGKIFKVEDNHVHCYVPNERDCLLWAKPISDSDFAYKDIKCNNDVCHIIENFANYVNVKTKIAFNPMLI